jgi:hypothetical protein
VFVRWPATPAAALAPQAIRPPRFDRGARPQLRVDADLAEDCRVAKRLAHRTRQIGDEVDDSFAAVIEDQAELVAVKGLDVVTATTWRMLGQRADAGQLFVDAGRSQLTRSPLRRTAQGEDEGVDRSVDGWVDLESTLQPPNSPAAPGVSAHSRPRLPAPHVVTEIGCG